MEKLLHDCRILHEATTSVTSWLWKDEKNTGSHIKIVSCFAKVLFQKVLLSSKNISFCELTKAIAADIL